MYNFNTLFNNSCACYYVNSYDEVLNMACPTSGEAVLFANLDQGLIWSKKFIQGQTYIQPYRIIPINTESRPPEPQTTTDQKLDKLIELLGGKFNESTVSNEHASEPTKKQQSSSI